MRERKTTQIVVRLTPKDRERFEREAERDGLDTSNFVRMTLKRVLDDREQTAAQGGAHG